MKELIPNIAGLVILPVTAGVTLAGFSCAGNSLIVHEATIKSTRVTIKEKISREYRRSMSNNILH